MGQQFNKNISQLTNFINLYRFKIQKKFSIGQKQLVKDYEIGIVKLPKYKVYSSPTEQIEKQTKEMSQKLLKQIKQKKNDQVQKINPSNKGNISNFEDVQIVQGKTNQEIYDALMIEQRLKNHIFYTQSLQAEPKYSFNYIKYKEELHKKQQNINLLQPLPADKRELKNKEALKRKELINGIVYYNVVLKILKGNQFSGIVTLKFKFHDKNNLQINDDLLIDFNGEDIQQLILNGKIIQSQNSFREIWDNQKLFIPFFALKNKQENEVIIRFSTPYSLTSQGLYSYFDKIQQDQYIYSQIQQYDCNKIFPCFDQPNIKGVFKLNAILPLDWEFLFNSPLQSKSKCQKSEIQKDQTHSFSLVNMISFFKELDGSSHKIFKFDESLPISCDSFSIAAGPFTNILNNKQNNGQIFAYSRKNIYSQFTSNQSLVEDLIFKIQIYYNKLSKLTGLKSPLKQLLIVFVPDQNQMYQSKYGLIKINESAIDHIYPNRKNANYLIYVIKLALIQQYSSNITIQEQYGQIFSQSFLFSILIFIQIFQLFNQKVQQNNS